MVVSMRRTLPALSYILMELPLTQCFTRTPSGRFLGRQLGQMGRDVFLGAGLVGAQPAAGAGSMRFSSTSKPMCCSRLKGAAGPSFTTIRWPWSLVSVT